MSFSKFGYRQYFSLDVEKGLRIRTLIRVPDLGLGLFIRPFLGFTSEGLFRKSQLFKMVPALRFIREKYVAKNISAEIFSQFLDSGSSFALSVMNLSIFIFLYFVENISNEIFTPKNIDNIPATKIC